MSRALILLVSAISVALAGFLACSPGEPPRFPHVKHLAEIACGGKGQPECLTCTSCHSGVRTAGSEPLPARKICAGCHDLSKLPPSSFGQPGVEHGIRFEHSSHLTLPKIKNQCVACHSGVVETGAGKTNFPPMSACLTCHQEDFDTGKCTPCHSGQNLSHLMPQTFLRHDQNWLRRHGMMATRSATVCNQCHSQTDCNTCHDATQTLTVEARRPDAVERDFEHRGDFMSRHPIEARSQPATCLKCHSASSCDSCHLARGISAGRLDSPNPHPVGWVGPNTTSRDFHGRAARQNILVCTACHDQGPATNCIRCHSVGGFGGNPHPRGWDSARSTGDGMCRYCHGN
jgi:hypothetical protein